MQHCVSLNPVCELTGLESIYLDTVLLVFAWRAETSQGESRLMIRVKQYQWASITHWNAMCGLPHTK